MTDAASETPRIGLIELISRMGVWLASKSWSISLRLGSRFMAEGRVVVPATTPQAAIQDVLAPAGWSLDPSSAHEGTTRQDADSPDCISGRQVREVVIRRIVDHRSPRSSLQRLSDDVRFRLAQVGIELVAASFKRVEPRYEILPQWGLSDESLMSAKGRRSWNARLLTVGDRAWSEKAWSDEMGTIEFAAVTIGPNSFAASRLDASWNREPSEARVRGAWQGLIALVLLIAGPLMTLALPRSDWADMRFVALGGLLAAAAYLALNLLLARMVRAFRREPLSESAKSWTRFWVGAGCLGLYVLLPIYGIRNALPVQGTGLVAAGAAFYILCFVGAFLWPAVRRALSTRRQRMPWLILLTTFGLLAGTGLVNTPSAMFLMSINDPQMIGSLSLGQVLVSGALFAVGVVVAVVIALSSIRAARSFPTLGALGGVATFTVLGFCAYPPVAALDAGAALSYGQHEPQLFAPALTPVCAALESGTTDMVTPAWLIGSQGATTHFMAREADWVEERRSVEITSSDVAFRSVAVDDRCD